MRFSQGRDDSNFGIMHADFHSGNYLIRKVQDNSIEIVDVEETKEPSASAGEATKFEVSAYDFDDIKKCWFVKDIAHVVSNCYNEPKKVYTNDDKLL